MEKSKKREIGGIFFFLGFVGKGMIYNISGHEV
jgi:hypothetical protein